jgi:hypothetical protein
MSRLERATQVVIGDRAVLEPDAAARAEESGEEHAELEREPG